jgi:hypothetical protein
MEIKIVPNSLEHFKTRRGELEIRIGGSEAPYACNIPYEIGPSPDCVALSFYWTCICRMDPSVIMHEEEADSEDFIKATKHGHRCEPIIADKIYIVIMKILFKYNDDDWVLKDGNYFLHPDLPELYGSSPDRQIWANPKLVDENNRNIIKQNIDLCELVFIAVLEIKACWGEMYDKPKNQHICQMHKQMLETGKKFAHYCACKMDHDDPENDSNPEVMIALVHYSQAYVDWMMPRLFYMSKCLMKRTPPDPLVYSIPPPEVEYKYIYRGFLKDLLIKEK